jgi:hypothetical protein
MAGAPVLFWAIREGGWWWCALAVGLMGWYPGRGWRATSRVSGVLLMAVHSSLTRGACEERHGRQELYEDIPMLARV